MPCIEEENSYPIVVFPVVKVGVDRDRDDPRLAIMLQPLPMKKMGHEMRKRGSTSKGMLWTEDGPYPTLLCTAREAALLIHKLQRSLQVLAQLPSDQLPVSSTDSDPDSDE
jgi:hypothetical protein